MTKLNKGDRIGDKIAVSDEYRVEGKYGVFINLQCDCGSPVVTKKVSDLFKKGMKSKCRCLKVLCEGSQLPYDKVFSMWGWMNKSPWGCEFSSVGEFVSWLKVHGVPVGLVLGRKDKLSPFSYNNCTWVTRSEKSRNCATWREIRLRDGKLGS